MKSTLAERLIEAMNGPPKVTGVALAEACGVSPPSVSGWRTGDSKTLEGSNLLAAAKRLGVRPEWLADGVGPKYADKTAPSDQPNEIRQRVAGFINPSTITDTFILKAIEILTSLKKSQREGAVANLKLYVSQLSPPRVGQTLPMAEKNKGAA